MPTTTLTKIDPESLRVSVAREHLREAGLRLQWAADELREENDQLAAVLQLSVTREFLGRVSRQLTRDEAPAVRPPPEPRPVSWRFEDEAPAPPAPPPAAQLTAGQMVGQGFRLVAQGGGLAIRNLLARLRRR